MLLLAVLATLPARAAGGGVDEAEASPPPSSPGVTLKSSTAPTCDGSTSEDTPVLTFGEAAPRTCRLRSVLLTAPSTESASGSGVRLTDVPAGTLERDRHLVDLNRERIAMNWMALEVLAGWTLANMAVGTAGYFIADDQTWRSFHQMNALFNVPILGTAVVGALVLAAQDPERLTLEESLRRGVMLERGLLVGVTLDVLAATFGAFLWERGRHIDSGQLTGWGRSLVLQGAVLLLYDIGLFLLNARYDARLLMMLSPDSRDGAGVAMRMRF
ncbi:hypothetical protein HPC49_50755 [Pyxidicoccus fallax]|uniref:Uncharacterized protein n=1 Tax=Pyxidicoccus fallax TaxID=394095 RepID=A0A848LK48_9BACT|nr:hypothetical protein [Pyxidicoccus fallax]NMO18137.1 hypothetical protein [Pyxidicoccus fallax]NPC86455.1 hypothetical protein [Pyxidicoccus fallax]